MLHSLIAGARAFIKGFEEWCQTHSNDNRSFNIRPRVVNFCQRWPNTNVLTGTAERWIAVSLVFMLWCHYVIRCIAIVVKLRQNAFRNYVILL